MNSQPIQEQYVVGGSEQSAVKRQAVVAARSTRAASSVIVPISHHSPEVVFPGFTQIYYFLPHHPSRGSLEE